MSPSPESQSAVEMPLGNQRPLGAATPLGQAVPRLQFMRPLGAKPLGILKPEIFNSGLDGLQEQWPNPLENAKSFSDSPFFSEARPAPAPSASPQPNLQAARSSQLLASPNLPMRESLGQTNDVNQQEVASTSSLSATNFSTQADALPLQRSTDAGASFSSPNEPAELGSTQSNSARKASQLPAESLPELNAPFDYNQATTVDWPGGFETPPPSVSREFTTSEEPGRSRLTPTETPFSSRTTADASSPVPTSEPLVLQAKTDSVATAPDSELSHRSSDFAITHPPSNFVQPQPNEPLPEPTEPEPVQQVVQRTEAGDHQHSNSENFGHGDSSYESPSTAQTASSHPKEASTTSDSPPSLQTKSLLPLDSSAEPYPTTLDWPGDVGQPAESPTASSSTVSSPAAPSPAVSDYGNNDAVSPLPAPNSPQPSSIQAKSSALEPAAETLTQDTNVISPSIEPLTSPPPRIEPELPASHRLEHHAVGDTLSPNASPISSTYPPEQKAQAETAVPDSDSAIAAEAEIEPAAATLPFPAAETSLQRAEAIPPETEQLNSDASLSESFRADAAVPESTGTELALPEPAAPEPAGPASIQPSPETPSTIPESIDFQHSTDSLGTAKPTILTSPDTAMDVAEPLQSATAQAATAPSEAESLRSPAPPASQALSNTANSVQTKATPEPLAPSLESPSPESLLEISSPRMSSMEQSPAQISLSPDPVTPVTNESESFDQHDNTGEISANPPSSAATPESPDASAPAINRVIDPIPTSPVIPIRSESPQQGSDAGNIAVDSPSSPSIINRAVELTPPAPASPPATALHSQPEHQPPSLSHPSQIAEASSEAKIQRSLPTENTTANLAPELQPQEQKIPPSSIQTQSEASQQPPSDAEFSQNQPSPDVQLQKQDQYFQSEGEIIEPAIASLPLNSDPSPRSAQTQTDNPAPSSAESTDSIDVSIADPASPQSPTIQRLTTENDASEKQLNPSVEPTLVQANFSDEINASSAETLPEFANASDPAESTVSSQLTSPTIPSSADSSPPGSPPAQATETPTPPSISHPPAIQANLDSQQREENSLASQPAASSLPNPLTLQASGNDSSLTSQRSGTANAPSSGEASASPPAPSSWSSIADLLAQSKGLSPQTAVEETSAAPASALLPSPSSPPTGLQAQAAQAQPTALDAYADLQPYASPSNVLQRSPAIQADAEIEDPEPEAIAETSPAAEPDSDTEADQAASAAKLEELAQVIYQMMQQRMAVERERLGSNYSSRFSR